MAAPCTQDILLPEFPSASLTPASYTSVLQIENFGHCFIEGLDRDKEHALLKAQGIIRRLRR